MAIAPILITSPKWAPWVIRAAFAAWIIYDGYFAEKAEADPEAIPSWRRFAAEWSRITPTGTTEDRAICTFDFAKFDGDTMVEDWEVADYQAVEAELAAWWVTVRTYCSASHSYVGGRWYEQRFTPVLQAKPIYPSGGPARIFQPTPSPGAVAGAALPYQVCVSVTERTPMPRHWGRFYLPGLAPIRIAANGRIDINAQNAIAQATADMYADLYDVGYRPIVPVTQLDKQSVRALMSITHVRVDDVPDVQRRRRSKQVAARTILPAA